MGQLVLFFVLQLLGSWTCLAMGVRRLSLACALGFVIGLAAGVFLILPVLLAGGFSPAAVVAVLGAATAVSLVAIRPSLPVLVRTIGWAAAFTAACIPVCAWNLATTTYDSEQFLWYARQLRDEQQLTLDTLSWLHSWGSFQIVAHTLSAPTGEPFLYGLAPAFSLSLLSTFALTLHAGLGRLGARHRVAWIALALAVLLAIPLVRVHLFYVHANWAAAGYLFTFASLFWLAEIEGEPKLLPIAFLALLAFAFCRVESPLFVALLVFLALSQTDLPRAALLRSYLPFTVILVGWLLLMAAVMPADNEYLTPERSLLMVAALVAVCALFLAREVPAIRRRLHWAPVVAAAGCVLAVGSVVATRFDAFSISFPTWQHDLWTGSYWGYAWWPSCAVLTILALRVPSPAKSRWLRYGIGLFFALVAVLAAFGDFYSSGRYGGLTRLTLHVVPLITFYFALTFVPWVSRRGVKAGNIPG